MDALYSYLLLIALLAGTLGAFLFVVLLSLPARHRRHAKKVVVASLTSGAIGLLFGVLSARVHFFSGHGDASSEPMRFLTLFLHHKAYWLLLVLCLLSFLGKAYETTHHDDHTRRRRP